MIRRSFLMIFLTLMVLAGHVAFGQAESGQPAAYPLRLDGLRAVWIDPLNGNDGADGATRQTALRTLDAAWQAIPVGETLTQGIEILLVAGTYPPDDVPYYFESRWGTAEAPIVIRAAEGQGTVTLPALNMFDVRHLALIDLTISAAGGDILHCEQCAHWLVRGVTVRGDDPATYNVQEVIKVNQSTDIYIEDSDISGAWDNAIDFVAVARGHVINNRLHDAGDWCAYAKGGSREIVFWGNTVYDCGTGGIIAGQGTGLEFMTPPHLTYEAEQIVIASNTFHDIDGAAFGVNGGSQIIISDNFAWRVGARSHVLEVGFGLRSCDGNAERCAEYLALGGWGVTVTGGAAEARIPNQDVLIVDNVIINLLPFQSQWQQFALAGSAGAQPGTNVPDDARADTGLVIRGNRIWNGAEGLALGIEGDEGGCPSGNPTCNAEQLVRDNQINVGTPPAELLARIMP